MPAGDPFAVAIEARFRSDVGEIGDALVEGVMRAWEFDDLQVFEEIVTGEIESAQMRLDLAVESAGWQGFQTGVVDVVAAKGDGFRWILDAGASHCNDCLERAAGGPYTFEQLVETIGIPGDAPTECDGGCRCSLAAA